MPGDRSQMPAFKLRPNDEPALADKDKKTLVPLLSELKLEA